MKISELLEQILAAVSKLIGGAGGKTDVNIHDGTGNAISSKTKNGITAMYWTPQVGDTYKHEFQADAQGDISLTSIVTPASGKKIVVQGAVMNSSSNGGRARVRFDTSDKDVSIGYPGTGCIGSWVVGAVDEPLSLIASGLDVDAYLFVTANYDELEGEA